MNVDHAWVEAVRTLWPGADVRAVRAGEIPPAARRELAFLPDAAHPRLLLPAGSPGAAAAALRRYSHDLGGRQRLTRAASAALMRTGLPARALRDRLSITGGGESIEDVLSDLLGREVVVSIGLGSARANRKPILHALTPGGRQLAFVKVGDTEMARQLIEGEAAALHHLRDRPMAGLAVPRVLHLHDWEGLRLLVLSALPSSALGRRPRSQPPLAAMRSLFAVDEVNRNALTASTFWAGMLKSPDEVSDARQADRFTEVIERIGRAYGDLPVDFGAWHGDWTPWNMAWHRGTVQLWDWERFSGDVPNGFDLLHYRMQEAQRTQAEPAYGVMPDGAGSWLAPLGLTGRSATAAVQLYLLELCRRYLIAAQGPIGEPLRPQAERLLELLTVHAGRPDAGRTT